MDKVEFIEELTLEAHTHCPDPAHNYTQHLPTCTAYAQVLYGTGYTPAQIIEAIITLGGDPEKGEWTSHPHPDKVLELLRS